MPRQDVLDLPVNGPYPVRPWSIRHPGTGERFSLGHDVRKQYSLLDYFLLMFPPLQLQDMVRLTNIELTTKNTPPHNNRRDTEVDWDSNPCNLLRVRP